MEVKINREIRNYTEAVFFGLSLRQIIFSACALAVAVAVFFLLKPSLGTETTSWINTYYELMKPVIEQKEKEAMKAND